MKNIGILTSGGDAPGMNAILHSVVRSAEGRGVRMIGIHSGYCGLIEGDASTLTAEDVSGIISRGGTVLHTARCPEFKTAAGQKKGVDTAERLGLDGIIAVGGDGTFMGAQKLSMHGIPTVGIPATIDNDIACTSYTVGFDTACSVATFAIDRLRDTSESHRRCSVVEVMGHKSGYLALNAAVAGGAAAVLIPEIDLSDEELIKAIESHRRHHSIIVMAEGCAVSSASVARLIARRTGIETRLTVLGHVQRGGAPTPVDRIFAARMGSYALELLLEGRGGRVVSARDNCVTDYDINDALAMEKTVDRELYDIFRRGK